MIGESDTILKKIDQSRGKNLVRFNFQEIAREDEGKQTVKIQFDQVYIDGPVTRGAIIRAIIADRYSLMEEFAAINNVLGDMATGKSIAQNRLMEYSDYQAYRAQAKIWADEILAEIK